MSDHIKRDWQRWDFECTAFGLRNTQGFTTDLKALEQHIKNLQRVCPKDAAGSPVYQAQLIISKLQIDYISFTTYLDRYSNQVTASPD